MIQDYQTCICDDLSLAGSSGGTLTGTNIINLGAANMGPGTDINVLAQITTTVTSSGAATLKLQLIGDTTTTITPDIVLYSSEAIALATLAAGYKFKIPSLPRGALKYLGARFVIGGADIVAGKATVALVADVEDRR